MSITFSHKSALELYCSPFILELLPYYRKTDNQLERKNYTPRRVALSRCSAPTKTEIRALEGDQAPGSDQVLGVDRALGIDQAFGANRALGSDRASTVEKTLGGDRALESEPPRIRSLSRVSKNNNALSTLVPRASFASLSLPSQALSPQAPFTSPVLSSQAPSPQPSRSSLSPQDPPNRVPSSIRNSLPFHFSLPIHCLVDDSNKRRAIKNLTCHVKCNPPDVIPLPKLTEKMKDSFAATLNSMQSKNLDSFSNIARSDAALNLKFSASSTPSAKTQNQNFINRTYCLIPPEYLFLQMAETMNFLDLLLLGFELCGTYFSGQGIDAFANTSIASPRHKPFTRANKIARFLDSDVASQTKGIAQATQASKFLLDNSDSPRESALALMLTLPRRLGGYALPRPLLNQRINIPRSSSQLIRNDHFRCDLLWPKEGLAIEYDSDLHHVGAQKIAKDASRRDALALLGIQAITVTNKQFASMNEMDKVAHAVAKTLGIRQRNEKRYNYQTRKIQLLQQLQ